MMYTLKGWCATATLLLVALCRGGDLPGQAQQRYSDPPAPPLPRQLTLPWEYILRETILKSITLPMPQDTGVSYKRPLDASFYGGPLATYSNDDTASNIVLSRGKVYRLLNGHWMLCQDECVDCEPCATQRDPLFKWSLQRVKRSLSADSARYEFQLTITPQTDDRLHASDFWPNSYVYVMSQQEQRRTSTVSAGTLSSRDDALLDPSGSNSSTPSSLEDSFPAQHHRSRNPWRLTERDDSTVNRVITRNNTSSSEKTERESVPEQKSRSVNMKPRAYRSRTRSTGNPGEESTGQLEPKLILGTDRRGQKHLVHVVPAELLTPIIIGNPYADHSAVSSQLNQTGHSNDTATLGPKGREGQIYQRVFRRVFDSLNAHRRSIEDFFKMENASRYYRTFPGVTDLAGFNWDNRAINHTRANFAQLRGDKALSQFYMGNEGRGADRRQNQGRYGYEDARQKLNDYYARYRDIGNYAETSRGRNSPMNFDWGEERRKMRIKPYYANSRSVSTITPSISSQQSSNFSTDGKSGFGNSFVNSTLIGKANNNSVGSGPITTRHGGNGQLFRPERLKSGDANRGSETSHHPFRIIVTTESPVMRGQHEALNHTKTLRITTLKTVDVDAPRSEIKSDGDVDGN